MTTATDHAHLLHTLALAQLRAGFCAPNPAVGAIVVKNNEVIAEGYHQGVGYPHAEVEALKKLTPEEACGATLYVSLEPCNHQGRTPPCTDLIIKKKIERVVFGFNDPNSDVIGNGQKKLREAGIICDSVPLAEIQNFYEAYTWYCTHQRPFITAKIALSLNGKIAGTHGTRVAITGDAIQEWVHQQRFLSDALLTTATTIAQDDPYLNVRLGPHTLAKPIYILDRRLRTPLDANIFSTGATLCFLYAEGSAEHIEPFLERGARCISVACVDDYLSIDAVLHILGEEGCHNVWLEAGGTCFQHFARAEKINKAYLAIGLKWLDPLARDAFSQDIFSTVYSKKWMCVGDEAICEIRWW